MMTIAAVAGITPRPKIMMVSIHPCKPTDPENMPTKHMINVMMMSIFNRLVVLSRTGISVALSLNQPEVIACVRWCVKQ